MNKISITKLNDEQLKSVSKLLCCFLHYLEDEFSY
ncbi:hypothetical protein [Elizabethkingia anophelis]|nr:hypothetical protein [Elizabethkingia anophelis]HBI9693277.1 hypothetical protein [Elizabethkingia anophelis]HBI9693719.1 hypothetical protein [Elizabethkingia anophelis]HBI9697297.1 hypothetical protein [Elizabethkingia anophelis]HBI9697751.1 hypothetical protein [Elizabethkingia anophelis]